MGEFIGGTVFGIIISILFVWFMGSIFVDERNDRAVDMGFARYTESRKDIIWINADVYYMVKGKRLYRP